MQNNYQELLKENRKANTKAMEDAERDNSPERRQRMAEEEKRLVGQFQYLFTPKSEKVTLKMRNQKILSTDEADEILDTSRVEQRPTLPTVRGNNGN